MDCQRLCVVMYTYCLMHFESEALRISTDISAKHGLPSLSMIYDGFLQLHVNGGAEKSEEVKREAEAALLEYFRSPIYLVEKPFFEPEAEGEEESCEVERVDR